MTTRWLAAAAVAAAAAGLSAVALRDGTPGATARAESSTEVTAPVERRDLVDRETIGGTLGYADSAALTAGTIGTLTAQRDEGASVRRGEWLYEIDGRRTGWLLYGRRPAWRDLGPATGDGPDVRQLERNLAALGYEPGRVDGHWTGRTSAAVGRFQSDRGLAADGTLAQGEIVFRPSRVRVGPATAQPGRRVAPGVELGTIAATRREVVVDLPADRQEFVRKGAGVVVDLPDGRRARGRVAEIGSLAEAAGDGATPTIAVRIELRGPAARRAGFDQAPVDVSFEAARARNALVVPVTALLALAGGGYAVEVCQHPAGRRCRRVDVEPGLHADGLVEVTGDLQPDDRVVVPS